MKKKYFFTFLFFTFLCGVVLLCTQGASAATSSGTLPTTLPTGMALWLAGDTGVTSNSAGAVSRWADQSGNARDFMQATSTKQPTVVSGNNGYSAIHFDGAHNYLSSSVTINGDTGMTVFLVSANGPNQASTAAFGTNSSLFWPETSSWGMTYFGAFSTALHSRFGTTQVHNDPMWTVPFNWTDTFALSEWQHNGTTENVFFNGQSVASFSGKNTTLGGVGDTVYLGQGANYTYFSGDVSEVIVYNRALSATDRQTVEQYLMTKYHL